MARLEALGRAAGTGRRTPRSCQRWTRLQIEAKLNPPIDLPQGYRAAGGAPVVRWCRGDAARGDGWRVATAGGRVVAIAVAGDEAVGGGAGEG